MMSSISRPALCATMILALPAGVVAADGPATVADAARAINLETFPLMPGGVSKAPRRMASLGYSARSDVRGAFAFQKKILEERGWKELPGGYQSDQSCSGAFGKDGFTVSVTISPSYEPGAAGLVDIRLTNHGNVALSKVPVPSGSKPLYAFPAATSYVTEKPVKETSEALRRLLTADGWAPYGHAGDSLFFKKNAVKLSAWPSVAPAQGGKTVIQLSAELMSVDLPAPPGLLNAAYADTTKALSLEVDMKPEALATFYKEALGKAGWKATIDKPVKIDFREMMIFRNEAKDIATLMMHEFEGRLRANIDVRTAVEFEEDVRLAAAEEAKRMAESAAYSKQAAEKAARDRLKVVIAVPAEAKGVERTGDRVEFKLAPGKAMAAVQSIHAALAKDGWNGKAPQFDSLSGTVTLSKKARVNLVIVYIDTGLDDADVMISAFGADIVEATSKRSTHVRRCSSRRNTMARPARLPVALRKLLAALTYEDKLRKFRYANEREPASEEELQGFIVRLARELYNYGMDRWPEDQDEELA